MDKFPYECTRCHRDYRAMSMVNMDDYAMTGICMHCYGTIPVAALQAVIAELRESRAVFIEGAETELCEKRPTGSAFFQGQSAQLAYVIHKLIALIDKEQA